MQKPRTVAKAVVPPVSGLATGQFLGRNPETLKK